MRLPIELINIVMEYTNLGKYLFYDSHRKGFFFRYDEEHINFKSIKDLFQSCCFVRSINIPEHVQSHILYKNPTIENNYTKYTIIVIDETNILEIHNYYSVVYSKKDSHLILF